MQPDLNGNLESFTVSTPTNSSQTLALELESINNNQTRSPAYLQPLPPNRIWMRYIIAVVCVVIATFLKLAQNMLLDDSATASTPFITMFLAVMVAAWYGGFGPGFVSVILAALASTYFFIAPSNSFQVPTVGSAINLILFIAEGVVISWLVQMLHGALMRSRTQLMARTQLAKALEIERTRFEVTLGSIGDAVIATDTSSRITFMNQIAEKLTGWNWQEAQGKSLSEIFKIVNELTYQSVTNPVTEVLQRGTIVGLANHTLLIAKDGREIPIDDSGAPIHDSGGQIIGVVLVFRDVGERRRFERNQEFLVRASEELSSSLDYEITLNNVAHLAVPYLGEACTISMANETDDQEELQTGLKRLRLVAMANVDPKLEQSLAQVTRQLVPEMSKNSLTWLVYSTQKPFLLPNFSNDMIDKSVTDPAIRQQIVELNIRSILYVPLVVRGKSIGVISFSIQNNPRRPYDENDIKLAEELARRAAVAIDNSRLYQEAQTAIRLRDEFLSIAAHELKTPITSLKGHSQLTLLQLSRTGTLDPERVSRALEVINKQADKLTGLVAQLLDVSRLEAGKIQLEKQRVQVPDLVAEVIRQAQAILAPDDKHSLILHTLPALEAYLDPLRFEQVVSNLVNNALKYSPEGGPIEIELAELAAEGRFRLSVKDQGVGVPAEKRSHLFERFYQAHSNDFSGGMGLGLYITRQIVELHGGTIRAEFPVTGGTCFIVEMPLREE